MEVGQIDTKNVPDLNEPSDETKLNEPLIQNTPGDTTELVESINLP